MIGYRFIVSIYAGGGQIHGPRICIIIDHLSTQTLGGRLSKKSKRSSYSGNHNAVFGYSSSSKTLAINIALFIVGDRSIDINSHIIELELSKVTIMFVIINHDFFHTYLSPTQM